MKKLAFLGGQPYFNNLPYFRPYIVRYEEYIKDLKDIFESTFLTKGKYVSIFKQELKKQLFKDLNVSILSSGTLGILLTLQALSLKDSVIALPSYTFSATATVFYYLNIKPVFIDIDKETFNISIKDLQEKLKNNKIDAIIGVYIFGNPPDIEQLEELANKYKIKLIFDAAHALGSKYKGINAGYFADAEVFSLSPTKLITSAEGGLVVSKDKHLIEKINILSEYGNPGNYNNIYFGLNARMSEFNALLGYKNLSLLDYIHKEKYRVYKRYINNLSNIEGISFQKIHNYNVSSLKDFAILIDENKFMLSRDILIDVLKLEGINTKKYFFPLHKMKIFKQYNNLNLENTEYVFNNIINLPIYPQLTDEQVDKISEVIILAKKNYKEIKKRYNEF